MQQKIYPQKPAVKKSHSSKTILMISRYLHNRAITNALSMQLISGFDYKVASKRVVVTNYRNKRQELEPIDNGRGITLVSISLAAQTAEGIRSQFGAKATANGDKRCRYLPISKWSQFSL